MSGLCKLSFLSFARCLLAAHVQSDFDSDFQSLQTHPMVGGDKDSTSGSPSPQAAGGQSNGGKCDCSKMGACLASGDPHVTTFDQIKLDFVSAPGHWWMVHTPDNHISIQALYRAGYGKEATVTHALAVSGSFIKDHVLTIRPPCDWDHENKVCRASNLPPLSWDGKTVDSLDDAESGVKVELRKKFIAVTLPDFQFINIDIRNDQYFDLAMNICKCPKMCGHCANFDGDKNNDYIYEKNGQLKADQKDTADPLCDANVKCSDRLIHGFALPPAGSLGAESANECLGNAVAPIITLANCSDVLRKKAEVKCKEINAKVAFDDDTVRQTTFDQCVMDECFAPGENFANATAEAAKDGEKAKEEAQNITEDKACGCPEDSVRPLSANSTVIEMDAQSLSKLGVDAEGLKVGDNIVLCNMNGGKEENTVVGFGSILLAKPLSAGCNCFWKAPPSNASSPNGPVVATSKVEKIAQIATAQVEKKDDESVESWPGLEMIREGAAQKLVKARAEAAKISMASSQELLAVLKAPDADLGCIKSQVTEIVSQAVTEAEEKIQDCGTLKNGTGNQSAMKAQGGCACAQPDAESQYIGEEMAEMVCQDNLLMQAKAKKAQEEISAPKPAPKIEKALIEAQEGISAQKGPPNMAE